jgi:hypothetical protein
MNSFVCLCNHLTEFRVGASERSRHLQNTTNSSSNANYVHQEVSLFSLFLFLQ